MNGSIHVLMHIHLVCVSLHLLLMTNNNNNDHHHHHYYGSFTLKTKYICLALLFSFHITFSFVLSFVVKKHTHYTNTLFFGQIFSVLFKFLKKNVIIILIHEKKKKKIKNHHVHLNRNVLFFVECVNELHIIKTHTHIDN